MPHLTRTPAAADSSGQTTPPTSTGVRTGGGLRRALGRSARLLLLVGVIAWAASPFGAARLTAFAEPGMQQQTPTVTPGGSGYPTSRDPASYGTDPYLTPTPTQGGGSQYQPGGYQPGYQPGANQTGGASVSGGTTSGGSSVQSPNNPYQPGVTSQGGSSVSSGAIVPGPMQAGSPGPNGTDPCYGDEVITFAPEAPRVGDELLIAVTSAHPHPYGRLAGTENTRFVRERPGQRGYVWEWTIQLSYPGQQGYTFYVDSTIPCQKVQLSVRTQLPTATPKPTRTPKPFDDNDNNGNSNSNDNNNDGGMAPYRDPYQ